MNTETNITQTDRPAKWLTVDAARLITHTLEKLNGIPCTTSGTGFLCFEKEYHAKIYIDDRLGVTVEFFDKLFPNLPEYYDKGKWMPLFTAKQFSGAENMLFVLELM